MLVAQQKSRNWKRIETLPDEPGVIKIDKIKRTKELEIWRRNHPEERNALGR